MDAVYTPPSASRRGFLAGAAGLAGALLLGGDTVLRPLGLELLATSEPSASVGYVAGSGGRTAAEALVGGARVVPASSIRSSEFTRARVSLRTVGFTAGLGSAVNLAMADVHLPSAADPAATVPFFALTRRAGSSSASTRMVVAAGRGLRVGVRTSVVGAAATTSRVVVFSATARRGYAPLAPGVYLVGLGLGADEEWAAERSLPATDDAVAWASLASVVLQVDAA